MSVIPSHPGAPSLPEVRAARAALGDLVRETPVHHWQDPELDGLLGHDTRVSLKLELFQHSGTFKARGALTVMRHLDPEALVRGVTAVSAGNHAAAVAYAANRLGTSAKVVMPKTANPARVALCQRYGAELVLVDNVGEAFETAQRIEREEGRTFVHPFDGPLVALGTATLGLEFASQVPDLEAVIVPIGGGGLAAGVSSAIKQALPNCAVYGVEPVGADSMSRSLAAGEPVAAGPITTIADSLAPPYSLPYSFGLCQHFLDDVVTVDDDEICRALYQLFRGAKLAVEPAGAATTAALLGPLKDRLRGKKVGLIVCGANVDPVSYANYLERGAGR